MTSSREFMNAVRDFTNPRIDSEQELTNLNAELDDIERSLKKWDGWELNEISDRINEVLSWVTSAKTYLKNAEKGIEQLQVDVSGLEGAIDDLTIEKAELESRLEDLEVEINAEQQSAPVPHI